MRQVLVWDTGPRWRLQVGCCVMFVLGVPPHIEVSGRPSEGQLGRRQGVAAHNISPRPLARAREIWLPTFSDSVAVSAPARIAKALASRLQSWRADGPSPPVVSTPKGAKSQPAAWHTALLCTTFARSDSLEAEDRPTRTAYEAEKSSGCETVTSTASGRGPTDRKSKSAGRSRDPGMACSTSRAQPANWDSPKRRSRRWLCRR